MIRVWPAKSNECKYLLVVYLNKMDFGLVVDNFSVPFAIVFFFSGLLLLLFTSVKSFFNLLGFRSNAKTFLYFSKEIPNSRILLHICLFSRWHENSLFFPERVPFFWHSHLFLNARSWFSALNTRADALDKPRHAQFPTWIVLLWSDEDLKWKTRQLKRDLKMILSLGHIWTKP